MNDEKRVRAQHTLYQSTYPKVVSPQLPKGDTFKRVTVEQSAGCEHEQNETRVMNLILNATTATN